jgi:hypothetical protein
METQKNSDNKENKNGSDLQDMHSEGDTILKGAYMKFFNKPSMTDTEFQELKLDALSKNKPNLRIHIVIKSSNDDNNINNDKFIDFIVAKQGRAPYNEDGHKTYIYPLAFHREATSFGGKACIKCYKESKTICSLCKTAYYCCKEHQKEDWNRHKPLCKDYMEKVKANLFEKEYILRQEIINNMNNDSNNQNIDDSDDEDIVNIDINQVEK